MQPVKVFIAEDHTILREGLKALLAADRHLEIVGEAEDGREAVLKIRELQPEVVLMDLSMPHINGTEAISLIKKRHPDIRIIALTVHKSDEYVCATLNAKADGYVLKDDSHQELLNAIYSVIKGKTFLSPGICSRVVAGFLSKTPSREARYSWDILTHRERQVIKLIAEGNKNRDIAESLSLSVKTIEKHRSNLMRKLDLHNASALTTYAIENGLIS